jgi:saccharopine dehydrogenase (NAD+, L-lysine-forming)
MVSLPAMSGEKKIWYPLFGDTIGYYVGHPEPLTLPRYFPGLRNATNRGAIPGLDDLLRAFRMTGLASDTPITLAGGTIRPRDMASALLATASLGDEADLPPPNAGGRIIVRGKKDGQFQERQYLILHPLNMGPNTGFSAAIGIAMMGRGQITTKGAFAPEGGVDPNIFMSELNRRDYRWEETVITKKAI